VWKRYWRLTADPFFGPDRSFVRTSVHEEALARLIDTIEGCGRLAVVRSRAGLGKSTILAQALDETRKPGRRASQVVHPVDGPEMLGKLAEGLGVRVPVDSSRAAAWSALGEAVRIYRWQRSHVVLVVDDAQDLTELSDRRDLERLTHLDPNPRSRLTVIQAFRESDDDASSPADWQLAIRLTPLTCSETALYIAIKLTAAGRADGPISPNAASRIHDLSGGSPRGIDRLATLALMAGAVQNLKTIPADVIDAVAQECDAPWPGFFAA
jgi:MSHA biogenesis protein MshM